MTLPTLQQSARYILAILLLWLCSLFLYSLSSDPLPSLLAGSSLEHASGLRPTLNAAWDKLWPVGNPSIHSDPHNAWKDHNRRSLHALMMCLASDTCSEHQDKVVILQDYDYREAFIGHPGGERIWSQSVLRTFDLLGVTYFFSTANGDLATYYNMLPDLIRAVIMRSGEIEDCWNNWDGGCLKTKNNPHGVRIQDLFMVGFFGAQNHPFGNIFTLTPEAEPRGETYLGYSIERDCQPVYVPPHPTRPRQVWVFGKYSSGFYGHHSPVSNITFLEASEALDVDFVGAWKVDGDDPIDFPGVRNLGKGDMLEKDEFQRQLVNSRAIVGLGDPIISPTPWYGLCWSIPFLNPHYTHVDDNTGEVHVDWSQHPFAAKTGEPHVYNIPRSQTNSTTFISQLHKAIQPHDPYIPPAMTQVHMSERVLAWLERDWSEVVRERMRADAGHWGETENDGFKLGGGREGGGKEFLF